MKNFMNQPEDIHSHSHWPSSNYYVSLSIHHIIIYMRQDTSLSIIQYFHKMFHECKTYSQTGITIRLYNKTK